MKHVRKELAEAAERMGAFAQAAAANGREQDARLLEVAADVCLQAAERFGTRDPLVRQDDADETRIRLAGMFEGCAPVAGIDPDAQSCPWVGCGVCHGCGWAVTQWTFAGRRYECLTQHACRMQKTRHGA